MDNLMIPKNYHSALNLHDTQIAIKTVKDFFQNLLAERLNLARVSAPLFVDPTSGLNDNLNGVERPVTFDIKEQNGREAEVVQSLAKWKRYALKKYGFGYGEGIYTDMNAIRRDEVADNTHSIFVDQWDWERIITKDERNLNILKETVKTVYKCLRKTEKFMAIQYDYIEEILPHDIFFVTTQELAEIFPDYTPKEREFYIAKAKGAVHICQPEHQLPQSRYCVLYYHIPLLGCPTLLLYTYFPLFQLSCTLGILFKQSILASFGKLREYIYRNDSEPRYHI